MRKKKVWNLKSKLIPKIRLLWFYSPLRAAAIKRAGGRCEICDKASELQVDHIETIVPLKGLDPWCWNTYISRTFDIGLDGVQCLCKECHAKKTSKEKIERAKHRPKKRIPEWK